MADELFAKLAAQEAHSSPWKPMDARQEERDQKRQAVLRTATRLFLERGWNKATMQELAERLHITKPALYNYFPSKEDILRHCILLNDEMTSEAFAAAEGLPGSGLERLRLFLELYAAVSTSERGAFVNRIDDRELPEDLLKTFRSIKRVIDDRVRRMVLQGVEDGSVAPCDVRLTTFALMGAIQSISRWYRPDGPLSGQEIAAEFTERLVAGLAPRPA
jgi:AcrR family transcriptional regulator